MTVRDLTAEPELAGRLIPSNYKAVPERGFVLTLHAFDWNCAQHITPRYTIPEIQPSIEPFRERIAELEAENKALRAQLAIDPKA